MSVYSKDFTSQSTVIGEKTTTIKRARSAMKKAMTPSYTRMMPTSGNIERMKMTFTQIGV